MSGTSKGLTLIELSISLAVSLVLIALVVSAYSASFRVFTKMLNRSDVFWNGQLALNTMRDEVRESLMVTGADTSNISFWWADPNANGTFESGEIVNYSLSGDYLRRTYGGSSWDLTGGVINLGFNYDSVSKPRLVTIGLTVMVGAELMTLETKARVRNEI